MTTHHDPSREAGESGGWEVPDAPDAVDLVVEVATMMAVFAAQRLERVDALRREALADAAQHGAQLTDVVERGVRLELAAALRMTEHAAGELLVRAEALVRRFPQMLEALSRGSTTERHAEIFVDAMVELEPEFHDVVVPRAVALAEAEAVGTFRRSLRRLIDTVRAQTLAERHETALSRRRVVVEPAEDGMAWLSAYMPAVEAHAIQGRLTAIAKVMTADERETRSLDQVRADVLGDLLIEGDTVAAPAARGIRASVVVTVPALSLLNDHATPGAEPASVEGVGPIPHARARELCGDADGWMRVLTHPETGAVLSVGRDRYRPPPELACRPMHGARLRNAGLSLRDRSHDRVGARRCHRDHEPRSDLSRAPSGEASRWLGRTSDRGQRGSAGVDLTLGPALPRRPRTEGAGVPGLVR